MFTTAQINLFVIDWNKWFLQKKISTSFFNKSILITLRKLQKKNYVRPSQTWLWHRKVAWKSRN